jgi:hypothetical protein
MLSEDVVLEVLVRLTNAAALFRCAIACRRWRALVTDPSFLCHRWPEDAPDRSFLIGLFSHQWRHAYEKKNLGTLRESQALPCGTLHGKGA